MANQLKKIIISSVSDEGTIVEDVVVHAYGVDSQGCKVIVEIFDGTLSGVENAVSEWLVENAVSWGIVDDIA